VKEDKHLKNCVIASLLVVFAAAGTGRGDYSGTVNSITTNSPIAVGEALEITITVENTGSSRWYDQWGFAVYNMPGQPGRSLIYRVYEWLGSGRTSTETRSVGSTYIPTTPGDYAMLLDAFSFDFYQDSFVMDNPPLVVGYTVIDPPPALGDTNGDGDVDADDYNTLIAQFGSSGPPETLTADFNEDGRVDLYDFTLMRANFGQGITQSAAPIGDAPVMTPEPATLIMMAAALPFLLKRKRQSK